VSIFTGIKADTYVEIIDTLGALTSDKICYDFGAFVTDYIIAQKESVDMRVLRHGVEDRANTTGSDDLLAKVYASPASVSRLS
jgi:hypothetical protein